MPSPTTRDTHLISTTSPPHHTPHTPLHVPLHTSQPIAASWAQPAFLTSHQVLPSGLFKFPRTHHLLNTGGTAVTRDDLVLEPNDLSAFVGSGREVIAEEKIDGANLGFSLSKNFEVQQTWLRSLRGVVSGWRCGGVGVIPLPTTSPLHYPVS